MTHVPSPDQLEPYRATCRRRDAAARQQQGQLHREGQAAAQRAADLLRAEFDVDRVVLFGSVARGAYLGPRSDVDLAVAGLAARAHARAVDRVQDVAGRARIDLVRIEQGSESLRQAIETTGIEL